MNAGNVITRSDAPSGMSLGQPGPAAVPPAAALTGSQDFLSAMVQESAADIEALDMSELVAALPSDSALLEVLPAMQWTQASQAVQWQQALGSAPEHTPEAYPASQDHGYLNRLGVASAAANDLSQLPSRVVLQVAEDSLGRGLAGAGIDADLHVSAASQDAIGAWSPARATASVAANVSSSPAPAVPVDKGAQPLMDALAQRIRVQQAQGMDIATVRLDPPQMGSLEIRIRQDAAGVQVHLQASHAEVGRQLSVLVDSLRQELQSRHADAAVTVAAGRFAQTGQQGDSPRQGQQAGQQQEYEIGQALQWEAINA